MSDLFNHFHPDERPFVDRAMEWVTNAGEYHEAKLTDFLDPRQAFIVQTLVNRHPDVAVRFDGGYPEAERRRAFIAPDYRHLESEKMGLVVLSVTSPDQKFIELDHGDYMGSILGLGMKRDKIGDIHVLETGCHCIVEEEISNYINIQLRQVHRIQVQTDILPIERLQTNVSQLEEMNLTVASFRLDGIASDVFRISRTKIVLPIKAGRCRINWKVEEDPSKPLKVGDVVSMKGLGRFKVLEIDGVTKKGRNRVKIGKFV
ncbi:YlmH family RNA-binding protein [Paenibacillus guangzhouensis]|uniref:YlmH family RNA-binding protein n=1 Tax=Paenibacillus guangzhouensis TaxID=1473112 RepID=UPI001266B20C|nr:YlmH/Sll1252 family protein [Paenibacillus guangzhouensis]